MHHHSSWGDGPILLRAGRPPCRIFPTPPPDLPDTGRSPAAHVIDAVVPPAPDRVPRVNRRDRLRELDLLRFAAAMAVVLFHFTGFGGSGPWPEPARELFPGVGEVTRYGYLGVDLFFMISGFVILMSVWDRGPGQFGISRVTRLMPAYWASVLLGAAIYLVFGLGKGVPGLVVPNLTMLQGGLGLDNIDAVYWTLWVELHFYFLIAVLAGIGITYRNCLVFMAGWMVCGVFADEAEHKLLQVMLVPTWSPYFIAGMALFLIYKFGPTLLLWGYVAAGWLLALRWSTWRTDVAFKGADENVVSVAVTCIFLVMILVATGPGQAWLRRRLRESLIPLRTPHTAPPIPSPRPGDDRLVSSGIRTQG
jgi:peptidoglycan/LPS O-acetylase OafA/YrhL